ncbi:tRNA adenosine(34) deaminase TadA [Kangiella koreensis]|uniref:tRNA-specific adenosine deaminase n=1 Tax=Kangiella koreensis (strain DSM 16069 / JCM 12317 / KCTC 12182 / SW-125) TaxID=523791 RepID=C7R5R7_KANKD|nr:tRNA adenosine(34) deaminase TadA [Kangiella koreensis]ACV27241.1 CMP/dCMP deaminase zinc-binding [Kangiella koreensis DSM 16069]
MTDFTDFDQHCMQRAFDLASIAEEKGEVPVGAVLAKDGEIKTEGFNQPIFNHDPTAHAEMVVLRAAGQKLDNYRLVDTTLYVTLEPCAMCAMAMVHARVSRVVFATTDPRTGAAGSVLNILQNPSFNHQCVVESGLLQEDCSEQLKRFFRNKRAGKDNK